MDINKAFIQVLVALLLFLSGSFALQAQVLYKQQAMLMGSVFEFTVVGMDSVQAKRHVGLVIAEIDRIENLISEWRPQTQISEVNRNAGIRPVQVDREVFELTKRALAYSTMSKGAFDISIAALDKVWVFDGSLSEMPTPQTIERSVMKVGYRHIILDSLKMTVFLEQKGMKIGFGSIGKGYAADKGREFLKSLGVRAGIVNASGDIATWGSQPNGNPWAIGINNPFKPHRFIQTIKLNESAIATSGNYEKYAEINGKRYSHIIDPRTGYPSSGLASVTVYGPSAEFANALSTSVMVMGKTRGLKLLKGNKDYRYILLTDRKKAYRAK